MPDDHDDSHDIRSLTSWPEGQVLIQAATYDERDNIVVLIDRVLAVDPEIQLLVIDDDSPDGTGRIVLERAAVEPRLHVLVRRGRRGLGAAIVDGFREARKHGFEIVVNMDADLSHDPSDIPQLLAATVGPDGADLVIGSRRVAGGKTIGWPLSRHAASWLVAWFTRWVLGVPVRDPSSGFRALRLATFDQLSGPYAQGYAFQEDLLWRLHCAGGRIVEVPITFTDRSRGASKADLAETCRSAGDLLLLAWQKWKPWP